MKRISMLTLVCCMAALAAAQSTNDQTKQDKMKGDKTVMGCVRSNNGMYMLEESNGKMAMLTSQADLSAHVGHTVALHGTWQKSDMTMNNNSSMSDDKMSDKSSNNSGMSGSNPGMSNSSGDMKNAHMKKMKMDHKGESFMINSVDMKSSSCDMPMKEKSKM